MVDTVKRRRHNIDTAVEADEMVTITSNLYGVEQSRRKALRARKFLVEPAYVRVSHGLTKNMGNYESLRVDVSVSLPCYTEEVEQALPIASDIASVFLNEELDRMGID